MAITLGAFCLVILTVSVLGGLLPLATVLTHTRLQVYLSFAAGTMLGAAFFHMMPEAIRLGSIATIHWAAFGLLALFFLERFFSFHHHEPDSGPRKRRIARKRSSNTSTITRDETCASSGTIAVANPVPVSAARALPWGSAAFGLIIHSLVGGIALGERCRRGLQTRCPPGKRRPGRFHRNDGAQAGRRVDDHVSHAPRRIVAVRRHFS